jgi:hypothetical protein
MRSKVQFVLTPVLLTLCGACLAVGQESATLSVPDIVKAGETVNFEIRLDRAPNYDGAILYYISSARVNIQSGVLVKAGETVCRGTLAVPVDAPSGAWAFSRLTFSYGSREVELAFKKRTFEVVGNSNLVYPTSAEVAVNPSQAQLLRREAVQVQQRLRSLKAALASGQGAEQTTSTLRRSVQESVQSLDATASAFHQLATGKSQPPEAQVFFADLRVSYSDALDEVNRRAAYDGPEEPFPSLRLVSLVRAQSKRQRASTYPLLAQPVIRALEQNELAYSLVAETGSLTFDLEVNSVPAGAEISYKRRGDDYQQHPSPTNSVVKSLPYAIWMVRLQKPGYQVQELEHDPFREPNHVINVELTR